MAIPEYVLRLRGFIGHDVLWLPSVSAVVVNEVGELLLGQRSDTGRWSVLSGVTDPGEQPAQAIVREVLEETGVEVYPERISSVLAHPLTYPNGDRCEFMNITFRCRPVRGTARVSGPSPADVETRRSLRPGSMRSKAPSRVSTKRSGTTSP